MIPKNNFNYPISKEIFDNGTIVWTNKTKNPWIIAAGTTATYIGVATTAMVMVLGGVEPKDMVIEFPQKENRTFGGVYTNDYRNKKSLENTPDWGTKN